MKRKYCFLIRFFLAQSRVRYLIAGVWNTAFGYSVGVLLYYALREQFHLIIISIVGNVSAITMSFLTYKTFVFQTKGNWLGEYCRTYIVYGATALVGILILWALVEGFGMPFWIGQGFIILMTVSVSYIGHKNFTFRRLE